MIATLMRSGSNQCTLNDRRSYDAWGGIRTGNATGEPHGRYCANLGHLADDESGFTYMRARYYEPGTGRFISEDPGRDGANWFAYACNCPTGCVDASGKDALQVTKLLLQALLFLGGQFLMGMWDKAGTELYKLTKWIDQLESLIAAGTEAGGDVRDLAGLRLQLNENRALLNRSRFIKGSQSLLKLIGYMMIVKAFILDIDWGDGQSALDIMLGGD